MEALNLHQDARKTESAYYAADPKLQLHVAPKASPKGSFDEICVI